VAPYSERRVPTTNWRASYNERRWSPRGLCRRIAAIVRLTGIDSLRCRRSDAIREGQRQGLFQPIDPIHLITAVTLERLQTRMAEGSMQDVHQLTARELLELFKTLECPSLAEMNGEYRGEQLRSPGRISTVIATLFTNNSLLFGTATLGGIRRGKRRIVTGHHANLLFWLPRMFPARYPRFLKSLAP
jgi:hypothetical protein